MIATSGIFAACGLGFAQGQSVEEQPADDFDELPLLLAIEDKAAGDEIVVGASSEITELDKQPSPPETFSSPAPWFPSQNHEVTISLSDFRQRVFTHNEQIQTQLIGILLAEQNYVAAKGIFEPSLVSEIEHVRSLRPNNAEQAASQSGIDDFDERNNLFSNGIETLLPSNARVRLGFNVFDLRNNLQLNNPNRRSPEYNTFLGMNFTQPLLQGAGKTASLASIRLAARESEIAFQDYRRGMMSTVAAAEAAYWSLFVAQNEAGIAAESLELARAIHKDTSESFEAGRSTQAEVMAAKVAILERESNLSLSRQALFDSGNNLLAFFASRPVTSAGDLPRTASPPRPSAATRDTHGERLYSQAFTSNPDYLRRMTQVEVEDVRVAYAINQKRPQLDLKASYGLNGLGNAFDSSLEDIGKADFPAWSIGVNMRVPLGGNIAGKAQLTAAQARKAQALIGLKEVENQLNVALESAKYQITSAHDSFEATQGAVSLRQAILDDERERLAAGRSNIRTIFEDEEELKRSKMTALRSLLGIQTARLQLELIAGTVLSNRGWELSSEELSEKTRHAVFNTTVERVPPKKKKLISSTDKTNVTNNDTKTANVRDRDHTAAPAGKRTTKSDSPSSRPSKIEGRGGLFDRLKKRGRSD